MVENLEIKIGVDTSEVVEEVKKVEKEIEYFKKEATINVDYFEKEFNKSMDNLSDEGKKEFEKITKSFKTEMDKLAKEGKLSADDLDAAFEKASKDLGEEGKAAFKKIYDEAKDKMEKTKTTVEDNMKQAGEGIGSALKTAGTALAAAGGALLALGASTTEYRQNQAQLNAAFEQAKLSTESATEVYKDLYKVIGDDDQAVESAANIAMLASSEQEAAKWAELASGVLGTFHDTLQPEAFFEAANETLKMSEATGAFTQMLEQTGIMSVDEFNKKLSECSTEAEKQALMLSVSEEAMGAAGESYNKATENIQKQREAQAQLNEAMGKLGEATAPIMTMLTELGANILTTLAPHLQSFAENYLPTIKDVLETIGMALSNTLSFLLEHSTVLGVIAAVIGTVVAAIGLYNAVAAVKAAMDAAQVTTIWGLVAAHTAQAAAALAALAPYILIVAAIAAVIAIIVLCIKHWDDIAAAAGKAWDWIKGIWEKVANWINEKVVQPMVKFFQNLWTKIKEIFGNVKEWFVEKFQLAWEGIKQVFSVFVDYFKMQWENVKLIFSVVKDVLTGNFSDAWEGIKKIFSNFTSFFSGLWEKIKNTFSALGSKIGDAIGGSVKAGINKVITWIENTINKAIGLINGAIGLINKLPGVSVGKLNKLSLPRLAKGGIVDSATVAMIGEAGKEAVVPLENNTEWMDKLAAKIGGNKPTKVILKVGEKELGWATIDAINGITEQTGGLQLAL